MSASYHTSVKISTTKDTQISPTWNLAIWETAYQKELTKYWKLLQKKATYVLKLEQDEVLELSNSQAQKRLKQLHYLREELITLNGFKIFTENLKDAYLETSVWLADYHQEKEKTYQNRITTLEKNNQDLDDLYQQSSINELLYLDTIINILSELRERKIDLSTKIFSSWRT